MVTPVGGAACVRSARACAVDGSFFFFFTKLKNKKKKKKNTAEDLEEQFRRVSSVKAVYPCSQHIPTQYRELIPSPLVQERLLYNPSKRCRCLLSLIFLYLLAYGAVYFGFFWAWESPKPYTSSKVDKLITNNAGGYPSQRYFKLPFNDRYDDCIMAKLSSECFPETHGVCDKIEGARLFKFIKINEPRDLHLGTDSPTFSWYRGCNPGSPNNGPD
ncbi:uncharacterized protein BYT42DRAFT_404318 [Radiomyces spectabilis]|uniref:uncharacterized protein n=1 Tax=Radiomyces spectabilis TaxID=64574 RepID=UPI00221F81C9|nr:uncharacterized protein BYT42DRAFT_404318 [Radiomyces spectabilis]KAI8374436.1 hypothetical protein BYT42DRAFT_404318 [Radiomyces spectabilis]